MKRTRIPILLGIMIVGMLFVGCDLSEGPNLTGSLELSIGNGIPRSTTLTPDFDMTPAFYDISGVGPNQATFSSADADGTPSKWTSLAVGEWFVTVSAYNDQGQQIGSGTERVTIEAGVTKEMQVIVTPLRGTGSLHLDFIYDANEIDSPVVSAICTPLAGGDSIPLDFIIDTIRGNAHVEEDGLQAGYYSLVMKFFNGDSFFTSQVHTVRIIKDQITEESFEFGRTFYSVSGQVLDEEGVGLSNVPIEFSHGYETVYTDNQGFWAKNGLDYLDGVITVTALSDSHVIAPGYVEVDHHEDDILFVGSEKNESIQDLVLKPTTIMIPKTLYDDIESFSPLADTSSGARSLNGNETIYTMTIHPQSRLLKMMEINKVLVSSDLPASLGGYGLLHKILLITPSPSGVEVLLKEAMLDEAIESGSINKVDLISKEYFIQSINTQAQARSISVTEEDGVHRFAFSPSDNVQISGSLEVRDFTEAAITMDFGRGQLDFFKLIVSPGFSFHQELTIGGSIEWPDDDFNDELFSIHLPPIPIWGPITFRIKLSLIAGAELNVEAGFITGFSYDRGYEIGFQYQNEKWEEVFVRIGQGMTIQEPVGEGVISAKVYGGLKLSAALDAVLARAGIGLYAKSYVAANAAFGMIPPLSMQYGIDTYLAAGIEAKLALLRVAEVSWTPPPFEFMRNTIAYSASGYVRDESGSGVEGVTLSFDNGASSVTTNANGYWFKHLLHDTVMVTPTKMNVVFSPSSLAVSNPTIAADFIAERKFETPSFSLASGSYSSNQTTTINHPDSNATIRYTTDGSTPTKTHGTIYSGPISITSSRTLKAIAYGDSDFVESDVVSATYTIQYPRVSAPVFSPSPGTYAQGRTVQISTATSNATIRYTTNGTNPSRSNGTVYNGPFALNDSTTIKAIAYRSGYNDSQMSTGHYVISNPGLTINPSAITNGNIGQTYTFTLSATGIPSGVSSVVFDWNFGDGSSNATGSRTVSVTNSTASTTISHSYGHASVFGLSSTVSSSGTTYGTATAPITIGTPIVRPEIDLDVLNVWKAAASGGVGFTTDTWDISMLPDNCQFDLRYNMYSMPDRIIVEYPVGTVRYDSGWRGSSSYQGDPKYPGGIAGSGSGEVLGFFRKSTSNSIKVTVIGGDSGTVWDYEMRARE